MSRPFTGRCRAASSLAHSATGCRDGRTTHMDFSLDAAVEVLTRTPSTLRAMLSGLRSRWTGGNEGPDTWSPQDVLGHLIHGEETDWIPRAQIILTKGESQAFEPFDRFAQARRFAGWSLERLLDRFGECVQTVSRRCGGGG